MTAIDLGFVELTSGDGVPGREHEIYRIRFYASGHGEGLLTPLQMVALGATLEAIGRVELQRAQLEGRLATGFDAKISGGET